MKSKTFFPLAVTSVTLALVPMASATLTSYDAQIAADHGGGLPHIAVSTTSASFDGTNGAPFDFGAVSGSSTAEFILTGDIAAGGRDGFLAVGANATWSLRYEQWDDTGQLGFTHGGVADYVFAPAVTSPGTPTHVAYQWDSTSSIMSLYLNGVLAGTATAAGFAMPTGAGSLGNNAGLSEGMVGTIDRVTIYDSALTPANIAAHADAWLIPEPSSVAFLGLGFAFLIRRRRR